MLRANRQGRDLRWDVGGNEGSKTDGSGVGKQQTDKAHWHQGLGPGGLLEG